MKSQAFKLVSIGVIALGLIFAGINSGQATELPPNVVDYLSKTYSGAEVRFDGVVKLPDNSMYVPVMPFSYADSKVPLTVDMTIPADSKSPDLILFSNNLSLLKIITNDKGEKTFISGSQVPLKVKLGLLPQDLVVPDNFVIPEELLSIVGDLLIPASGQQADAMFAQTTNKKDFSIEPVKENPSNVELKELKPAEDLSYENRMPSYNKDGLLGIGKRYLYVTNINTDKIYVIDPDRSKIIKSIDVGAIPYKAVISPDGSRLYTISLAGNSVSAIDTQTNELISTIKVGKRPSYISISPDGQKLLVSNSCSETISVISTDPFEVEKDIPMKGIPGETLFSRTGADFFMFNKGHNLVNLVNLEKPEPFKPLLIIKNPYAMTVTSDENVIYIVSRAENALVAYNVENKEVEKIIELDGKPVDLQLSNDEQILYVLDAQNDKIILVSTTDKEITNEIDLKTFGFPTSFTFVEGKSKALVSNADADKITVVDLTTNSVLSNIEVGFKSKDLVLGPVLTNNK